MVPSLSSLLMSIRAGIEMNRNLAFPKPETALRNPHAMRHRDRIVPTPTLKFKTALVVELAALILGSLNADQRRTMEGIRHSMEANDDLLDETYRIARQFEGTHGHAERICLAQRFLDEYELAIVNLARTIEMCDQYLRTRPFDHS